MKTTRQTTSFWKWTLFVVVSLLASSSVLVAGTVTVTNTNDSGAGSLRQAILDAQSAVDNIVFSTIGTIALTGGELRVDKDITIMGPDTDSVVISGEGASRIFVIESGDTLIASNLTLTNGKATKGGAVLNEGSLVLRNCTVIDNLAQGGDGESNPNRDAGAGLGSGGGGGGIGGAVYSDGALTLENCTFSGNQARGGVGGDNPGYTGDGTGGANGGGDGGTYAGDDGDPGTGDGGGGGGGAGRLGMNEGAGGSGGAFGGLGGSGVSEKGGAGGGGAGLGGAVFVKTGSASILNCTIYNNRADGGAGGVGWYSANMGVAGKGLGAGVFNLSGSVTLSNALIGGNYASTDDHDVYGVFTSTQGHNFIQYVGGATIGGVTTGNITGEDPKLDSLADRGGPARVHALKNSSPAINGGTGEGAVPATDERYYRRVNLPDMGAYEFQVYISGQPESATKYETEDLTLSVTAEAGLQPITYQWRKNGVIMIGETSATLELDDLSTDDEGDYDCVATSAGDSTTSAAAKVKVKPLVAPIITVQPESQEKFTGKSVTFSLTAVGKEPMAYQWKKDGVVLTGQTADSMTIDNIQTSDDGYYTCVVTNDGGSTNSAAAKLTVLLSPTITKQPESQEKFTRQSVTFSIELTGSKPLTYQWKKNGEVIYGATKETLTLANLTLSDSGSYSVTVSNEGGSADSDPATLNIYESVTITKQPIAQEVYSGASVTFTVEATGKAPISYQWRKNQIAIPGETANTLVINPVQTRDSGSYTCAVTNGGGTVTSAAAALTCLETVAFTTQPKSQEKFVGQSVTFETATSGSQPITYKWKKDGSIIGGETGATLTISPLSTSHAGVYTCEATNGGGTVVSDPATLTILKTVEIIEQPQSQTLYTGLEATFKVTAAGAEPITYQWRKSGQDLGGQVNATLSIKNLTLDDAGDYTCVCSNGGGSEESDVAKLTVHETVVIKTQPESADKFPGESVTFAIEASGYDPITYQWRKDGIDIPGATETEYSIEIIEEIDTGKYSCVATNGGGSVTSDDAILVVLDTVKIVGQPEDQVVKKGSTATFSIKAEGTEPITYQWRKDGVDIERATTNTLTLASVDGNDTGHYSCVATNGGGSATSESASLSIKVTLTTAMTEGGDSIEPNEGEHEVVSGQPQSIQTIAKAGYHFTMWSTDGAGSIEDPYLKETYVTLTDDCLVLANFEKNTGIAKMTIGPEPDETGTTDPESGVYGVNIGEPQKIIAFAKEGYHFVNWSVKSGEATINNAYLNQTTVILQEDAVISANFAAVTGTVALNVIVSPPDSGSTSPNPGEYTVFLEEPQQITAIPGEGYHFVKWSVSEGGELLNDLWKTTTVTLSDDATVTARFEENTGLAMMTLAASPSTGGTTNPGTFKYEVYIGEPQRIIASPAHNYHFVEWVVDGDADIDDAAAADSVVTLNGTATVTALFEHDTVDMTMAVSPTEGGTVEPETGSHTVNVETAQAILATPADEYKFVKWTTDGQAVFEDAYSAATSVVLIDDATVTANFSKSEGTAALTVAHTPVGGGSAQLKTLLSTASDAANVVTTPITFSRVQVGESTSIVADAEEGYLFSGWTVKGSAAVDDPDSETASVKLSGDAVITANFANVAVNVLMTTVATPEGAGTVAPEGTTSVYYGSLREVFAAPSNFDYVFCRWIVDGNADVEDEYAASTIARVKGNAKFTAKFIPKASASELTQKTAGGSGTVGRAGTITVPIDTLVPIEANPLVGYVFVSWTVEGDASVTDPYANVTTIRLNPNAAGRNSGVVVTANFTAIVEPNAFKPMIVRINLNNQLSNRDLAVLRNMPMTQKYFNPNYDSAQVSIDGVVYSINQEAGLFTQRQEGVVFYVSRDRRTALKMNLNDGLWNFRSAWTDLSLVDNDDGVDIVLSVNDDHHGINLQMNESAIISFRGKRDTAIPIEVNGTPFDVFAVGNAKTAFRNDRENVGSLRINQSSVRMPEGILFDPDNESVTVTIDAVSFIIPGRSLIQRRANSYFYNNRLDGVKFKLDLNRDLWSFQLIRSNLWSQIRLDDGLDVRLTLGDCEGGDTLKAMKRTYLRYSNFDEIEAAAASE